MIATAIAAASRLFTGARARWVGCAPAPDQRIYFANHTSNLDFVLLWASFPTEMRHKTRPVAAQDYWRRDPLRRWLAAKIFKAVLIERKKVSRENNPMQPMLSALEEGSSLIIFPEGTRNPSGEISEFKSGLYHLAKEMPRVELVPVFIENLNRVLPKGEFLPVPILCSVNFGAPLFIGEDESKADFMLRARNALLALRPL
jgi:1-acyl-sn-glycerol-3-phosphate acyltransferase